MSGADQFAVKLKTGQELTSPEDRAKRLSARSFKGWHTKNLRKILPLYAKQVEKELGGDGKAGVCALCERPFITDRAFRAVEKALDRELGSGSQVNVQLLQFFQQLGCRDENEARQAISAWGEVRGLDEAQQAALALDGLRAYHTKRGERVLVVSDATEGIHETQNGSAADPR